MDLNANTWSVRHRGNFFLTGTLKTGDWQFGLKETLRLKAIDWHVGNLITAGVGYKWEF